MEFHILGPLEVRDGDRVVPIRRPKHKALLGALLLHAGEAVSVDHLLDDLWGERPPPTAKGSLQNAVSALRKLFGTEIMRRQAPGYLLDVERERVDLFRFEALLREARRTAGEEGRAEKLQQALALWRGRPLADLAFEPFVLLESPRLEDLRTAAREELIEARLAMGEHAELIPELEALVAEQPFNEHLRGQLMLALYRAGRQAEALEAYREARRFLVEELGLEPSKPLRELEQAILGHDPALTPTRSPRPVALPMRKTATVLVAELGALDTLNDQSDPEALSRLRHRHFAAIQGAVERHGGAVERFLGDAILGVFGVPKAHEDDALRALRAALEMRDEPRGLADKLELRIGVDTGAVFVSDTSSAGLVTGAVVNSGKRLAEVASAGEILLGAATVRLVHASAKTEPLEPLRLRERRPLGAWRLRELIEDAPAIPRRLQAPLVGRGEELVALQRAFDSARDQSRCSLVVLVGEPGIGKTRLAGELIARVGEQALVLLGRCASYGQGVTWLPLAEIVREADGETPEALRALLAAEADGDLVERRIAGAIGASEEAASPEETNWAIRRLFEVLARERPLLLVFEDVHWAEPALLDLIEYLGERASGPILVVCLTRPELLETRAEWAKSAITLASLPEADVRALVDALNADLDADARARVVEVAEGNPLFAEQLVARAQEEGSKSLDIAPPSIEALLASRLDLLPAEELAVLQRAAVIGRRGSRAAVIELSPGDRASTEAHLRSLAEKGFIDPGAGEDVLVFHHVLVRNVAYAGIPKGARAELHEQAADWLDRHAGSPDEVIGYHLEQAYRYLSELQQVDERALNLATLARRHLAAAGRRAYSGQDFGAAVKLLERAAALVPEDEVDVPLELNVVQALSSEGKGREAMQRAGSVAERAAAAGDRVGELCARLEEGIHRSYRVSSGGADHLAALVEQALPPLKAAGDDFALMIACSALAQVASMHSQMDAMVKACDDAATYGQRAGLPNQGLIAGCGSGRFHGTTPASELLAWHEEQDEAAQGHPRLRAHRAAALAMLGRSAEARSLLAKLRTELVERGSRFMLAAVDEEAGIDVELLADDPVAAVAVGEEGCRVLEELGEETILATAAGSLAQAYYALDRIEEAEGWAGRAVELGPSDDATSQVLWRQVKAKVLARRGEHAEAERLAREAVEICDKTDLLNDQASVYADLAEVLAIGGCPEGAVEALEQALARYERKENLVMAGRVRARLAELSGAGKDVCSGTNA